MNAVGLGPPSRLGTPLPAEPATPPVAARRVLFVAYIYPPVGGAGVQRTTKFVKYLPQFGWLPSVLTVANPSVPLYDTTLAADLPGETVVRRARTWEPRYALKAVVSAGSERPSPGRVRQLLKQGLRGLSALVLQPDPQVLWLPQALREGSRLLRELPHAAIVATAPPFSAFLVGAALSRRFGLPLVLDYRDEWTISSAYWENRGVNPLSRPIQAWMQRRVVRAAQALVATTRSSAQALAEVRRAAHSSARVTWIYNGFDPDDFIRPAPKRLPGRERYRLAYVGTLWNLTSVAPLVNAIQELCRRWPALGSRLELVFAGRRTGDQQQLLAPLRLLPCRVVELPYLDHTGALDLLRSVDSLCALLSDVPNAGRVVPAKIFEYMAAKNSILAIGPPGEMWDLLRDYPGAHCFTPADTSAIAEYLAGALQRHDQGHGVNIDSWDASPYDRRSQAQQLALLLGSLIETARPPQ